MVPLALLAAAEPWAVPPPFPIPITILFPNQPMLIVDQQLDSAGRLAPRSRRVLLASVPLPLNDDVYMGAVGKVPWSYSCSCLSA